MRKAIVESLGNKIRRLREEKGLSLRTIAFDLNIDQAILSKIENDKRKATRQQITKLSDYFNIPESELVIVWLSDKVLYELKDEDTALKVLQLSEEQVSYSTFKRVNPQNIINTLKAFFSEDKRVEKVWLFGSFARGDQQAGSDLDIMVRFVKNMKISMFDVVDLAYQLEQLTSLKIDLVEEFSLQPYAWNTAQQDLIEIYG
ncbi:MAG: XRE family transcriptional regulator [Pyrinomonadaceae bacterium]|nr:XRE family transcriptional regulator [Sphingobacteriaceae bacterium]